MILPLGRRSIGFFDSEASDMRAEQGKEDEGNEEGNEKLD
jgi:hypothetical protein